MKLDTKFIINQNFNVGFPIWELELEGKEFEVKVPLIFNGGCVIYSKNKDKYYLCKSPKLESFTTSDIDKIKGMYDPMYFKELNGVTVYESNVNFAEIVCKIDFWIEKYDSQRQESMFYQGDIVNCTVNGKTFNARAVGEIRVKLDEVNGTGLEDDFIWYKNDNATEEFWRRNYTDKDLQNLEFENNNWFTIDICENDEWEENDQIEHTFDECVEELVEFLNKEME
jgi:hypothetical protein